MPESKKFINRLTIASLDLENCIRFLNDLSNNEYGSIAYEALLISAIIFYARPFSQNEKRNSVSPSESRVPDSIISGLSQTHAELHEMIITLRNKAVAHAEWGYHPTGVSSNKIIMSKPFSIWNYFQSSTDIKNFKILSGVVRDSVQNEQANELRNLS